jgi:imidazolonepropionase-like amidohydrolase
MRQTACLSLLLLAAALPAQRPAPGAAQKGTILVIGATAHIGNGQVIPNSALVFERGKLTLVADAGTVGANRSGYWQVVEASDLHAYPGFIAADSRLGLVEVDAVRATQDFAETGDLNPNARTIIAYNTDSEVIPTVRSNGVLLAQVAPTGGRISGTSSVVQLDAWNWEDAALRMEDGMHLYWPTPRPPQAETARRGRGQPEPAQPAKDPYQDQLLILEAFFSEAKAYSSQRVAAHSNPRFEAMRGLFAGSQRLYISAGTPRAIMESVLFAEKHGVRPVIKGGEGALEVADFLVQHRVPVILAKTHRLPGSPDSPIDQPYTLPAQLHQKGVKFCIAEDGGWRQRNLPFQAGHAVGYGLPYEAAVGALTLEAAAILGISDQVGSLEVGKDATFFLSKGDALDMRTNQVTAAFIQGRQIDLDNKQKVLYRTYEAKYRQ